MAAFKYFRLLFQNLTDTKFLITGEFLDKGLVSFCICRKICSCKFWYHFIHRPILIWIWFDTKSTNFAGIPDWNLIPPTPPLHATKLNAPQSTSQNQIAFFEELWPMGTDESKIVFSFLQIVYFCLAYTSFQPDQKHSLSSFKHKFVKSLLFLLSIPQKSAWTIGVVFYFGKGKSESDSHKVKPYGFK